MSVDRYQLYPAGVWGATAGTGFAMTSASWATLTPAHEYLRQGATGFDSDADVTHELWVLASTASSSHGMQFRVRDVTNGVTLVGPLSHSTVSGGAAFPRWLSSTTEGTMPSADARVQYQYKVSSTGRNVWAIVWIVTRWPA